jgi:hypothetical protein
VKKFSEGETKVFRAFVDGAVRAIAEADAPLEAKVDAAIEVGRFLAEIIKKRVEEVRG